MKSSIWILLYVTILVAIVFFEYKKSDKVENTMAVQRYSVSQNRALESLILSYTKPLDSKAIDNKKWGIFPKKIKKVKEEKLTKKRNETKPIDVTLKEKTLCIEKECFKLLGIFQQGKKHYASFYNKNSKQKVKEYLEGEILKSPIKIKSIRKKSISFKDRNSTREWSITLFDINSSKYKPKDFKE